MPRAATEVTDFFVRESMYAVSHLGFCCYRVVPPPSPSTWPLPLSLLPFKPRTESTGGDSGRLDDPSAVSGIPDAIGTAALQERLDFIKRRDGRRSANSGIGKDGVPTARVMGRQSRAMVRRGGAGGVGGGRGHLVVSKAAGTTRDVSCVLVVGSAAVMSC